MIGEGGKCEPKLEAVTKCREVVMYQSSPGHVGLIVTEVIVLLPELLLNIVIRLLNQCDSSKAGFLGCLFWRRGLVSREDGYRWWVRALFYVGSAIVYLCTQSF